jgi:hypothetical protein
MVLTIEPGVYFIDVVSYHKAGLKSLRTVRTLAQRMVLTTIEPGVYFIDVVSYHKAKKKVLMFLL